MAGFVERPKGHLGNALALCDDYGSPGVLLQGDIVYGYSLGKQVAKNFVQCLPVGQPNSLDQRIQHHIEVRRVVGSFIGDDVGVWVVHGTYPITSMKIRNNIGAA